MTILFLAGLYALFLVIGWLAARGSKADSTEEMLLAGRVLPLWLATLSMTATWVDGGYLLGTAEGAYKSGIPLGVQGGLFFGLSLILGGLLFAAPMRRAAFTTLVDLFDARFGMRWAAVLSLPALLAELFWSAELLVAIGSTFSAMLDSNLTITIIVAAMVVTAYTMAGGMWAVAYTDAVQLGLVALGLLVALPLVLDSVGGVGTAWQAYATQRPDRSSMLPPWTSRGEYWTSPTLASYWDTSMMLLLGGIPWNCYFQRVLSCRSPAAARGHSLIAGVLTIAFTIPPLLFGVAALSYAWPAEQAARLQADPALTMPLLLRYATPTPVALLGLAAIIGAVTSSYSASLLSAGAMLTWNGYHRLWRPQASEHHTLLVMRVSLLLLSAGAVVFALYVRSVQALWFFTADLVFVLLFPQLFWALFDRGVTRTASISAFCLSLVLRLGGGEPLFSLPGFLPYAELGAAVFGGSPQSWVDGDAALFPVRSLAAAVGFLTLPLVSHAPRLLGWRAGG